MPATAGVGRRELWAVNALLAVTALALLLGLVLPIITLERLLLVRNTFSIVSGTAALASEGRYALLALVGGFSIVLPVIKLIVLATTWNRGAASGRRARRALDWITILGRWSMLDVFIVAVLVASVQLGALADVQLHAGLYAFAVSVLLAMALSHHVRHALAHRLR